MENKFPKGNLFIVNCIFLVHFLLFIYLFLSPYLYNTKYFAIFTISLLCLSVFTFCVCVFSHFWQFFISFSFALYLKTKQKICLHTQYYFHSYKMKCLLSIEQIYLISKMSSFFAPLLVRRYKALHGWQYLLLSCFILLFAIHDVILCVYKFCFKRNYKGRSLSFIFVHIFDIHRHNTRIM